MCGIFGIVKHEDDRILDENRLKETAHILQHRGPDSQGIYLNASIGLVHTRLSLLDLNPRSDQPFWDTHGRYCLIYNGEIYNFEELRAELEQRGVRFRTTSDTEVLLECIINCGLDATLSKLEGMFAFALYDKVENTLLLVRDRFGIKPLFIYDEDDAFIFASEIKAMRPWINFEPDFPSISSFLYGFGGPTKGHSFYKDIKILPPGSVVKVRVGELQGRSVEYSNFFSMVDFWDQEQAKQLTRVKSRHLVDNVEQLLLESVKKQLIADAPVGALCSGGVDSSVIMAMASKFHSNLAIFHANIAGPLSEYEAAAKLANHLKLDLKTVEVHDQDFIDYIPEVIEHYGHPFYTTPHSVPFLLVSKLVRRNGVKAVLSGEGSDECYLGYDFLVPDSRKVPNNLKGALKKFIQVIVRRMRLPAEDTIKSSEFVMGFSPYSSVANISAPQRRLKLAEIVTGLHNRFEVALETEGIRTCVLDGNMQTAYRNYMKSIDFLNYNLRALLHRNDSMGMAASIESRFPFLDSRLVNMAVNMPYDCKVRFSSNALNGNRSAFRDKWILREVADRYLPGDLSQRPKAPFPTDAYHRLQISPTFFKNSLTVDLFGLSQQETHYLIDNSPLDLKLKLLQLDVWAHVSLNNLAKQSIKDRLKDHVTIKPLD